MVIYPNQKIIHINKGDYTQNYLTVGIDEWIEASKVLKSNTFKVYLYLCGNKDGLDLALSRQDVINKLGISLDSYKRAIKEITDKKYIKSKQGNVYDFRGLKSDMDKLDPNIIKNGSTFYCMDTIEVYMYDESTKQWLFQTKVVSWALS